MHFTLREPQVTPTEQQLIHPENPCLRGTSAQLKSLPRPRPPEGEKVCHVSGMCILLRKGTKSLGESCSGDPSMHR